MNFWQISLLLLVAPMVAMPHVQSHAQAANDSSFVGLPSPSTVEGPIVRDAQRQIVASSLGTTTTRQIANAPGWQRATSYSRGTNFTASRALAGPGWKPGSPGEFTDGLPVYLWIAQSAGVSAASGNGPQSCATPGTSTVTESTGLVWRCLTQIDYDTISAFLFDDDVWRADTDYLYNQYAVSDNRKRVYRITPDQKNGCKSGARSPTGTGGTISDGGCTWQFVTGLGYSSLAGHIPKQRYTRGAGVAATLGLRNYFVGNIWYGGVSRMEYIPGQNGENDPIMAMAHTDFTNNNEWGEATPTCENGAAYPDCGAGGTTFPTSYSKDYRITLQAQPSDSFVNNPDALANRLAYDSANGVSIHAIAAPHSSGPSGVEHSGDALNISDSAFNVYGLQIKSDRGAGIDGFPRANHVTVQNDIVDAAGWCPDAQCAANGVNAVIFLDTADAILDSLIVMRGNQPGAIGVMHSYTGYMVNDTVINLGQAPDSVCVVHQNVSFGNPFFENLDCSGFAHEAAIRSNGVSTLAEDIDATTTLIATASPCCLDDLYVVVDSEEMHITSDRGGGAGATMLIVERGIYGTKPAPHRKGAPIAGGFAASESTNNAVSNAPQTVVTLFSTMGAQYGSSNLPGVGATCGAAHTSCCFGLAAIDQFLNPTGDFRLKSTAEIKGAGVPSSGISWGWNVPFVNSSGILNAMRRGPGHYDIGAWVASGS